MQSLTACFNVQNVLYNMLYRMLYKHCYIAMLYNASFVLHSMIYIRII